MSGQEPKRTFPLDLRDGFAFGGLALNFWGCWQVYQPAAWIVTGAALFFLAIWRAK